MIIQNITFKLMKGTDKLAGIVFLCKNPCWDSWWIRWGGLNKVLIKVNKSHSETDQKCKYWPIHVQLQYRQAVLTFYLSQIIESEVQEVHYRNLLKSNCLYQHRILWPPIISFNTGLFIAISSTEMITIFWRLPHCQGILHISVWIS